MPVQDETIQQKCVLAIDLGSGGPKVGLVDQDGYIKASTSTNLPTYLLPDGGAEQNPAEWWSAIVAAIKEVIHKSGIQRESIIAIACTSQWSVTVPVDENGEALMNAVHWIDTRGGSYNRLMLKGFPSIQGYGLGRLLVWMQRAGMPPSTSGVDSLGHILFIKNERPEIYSKTYKFLEPIDYLNLRLTGRCAATLNTVFPYVLTDNRTLDSLDYDPTLLQITGIEKAKLPEILPIDGIVGAITPSIARELGLSPNTVVLTGVNDNSTSAVGSGAVVDFESVAVMGTSGYLACHLPFKKTDITSFITTMPSGIPGRYLLFAELGNNGKVLDSYLNNLVFHKDEFLQVDVPPDIYEQLDRIAEQVLPGSEGVLFLPWLKGTFAPSEDQYLRGGFLNISHQTTRAHLTRAVLEGIALNWRWVLAPAERFIGRKFDHWRLGGGGALSDTWAQIMADVVGIPMHQMANPRMGNVLGIAFLAFNRLGLLSLEEITGKVEIAKVYQPREKYRPVYDQLYRQFLTSLRSLKPIFHALNK
jgi:xylulokinase